MIEMPLDHYLFARCDELPALTVVETFGEEAVALLIGYFALVFREVLAE